MRQLLSSFDVAHCHEDNLSLHTDVWLTRMVAENHAAFSFLFLQGANKQIFRDWDLCGAKPFRHRAQCLTVEDVAALYADDFAFGNWLGGKETFPVNRTFSGDN